MFKIIQKTKYWFIISSTLMLLSIVSIAVFGLRLGIDYTGGSVIEFKSSNVDRINLTEEVIKDNSFTSYQIKESGSDLVIVKLPNINNEQYLKLKNDLTEKIGDYSETSYSNVGPVISKDLTNRSILSIILASIGIIVYIAYTFRKIPKPLSSWRFGLAAIVALIHDLLITVGFVSILGHFIPWMEVDALFITALLTIMGFSVHDTIVVYDRLRENFLHNPNKSIAATAEESVNQTLARSINTSVTVIIVLASLLVLGGASIKNFIVTLIIGVFFGTYSSIFIATALVVLWHKNIKRA